MSAARRWGLRGAALVAPLVVAFVAIQIASRGTAVPIPALQLLALGAPALAGYVLARHGRWFGGGALALDAAVGALLLSFCGAPLPPAAPYVGDLPPATPPPTLAVYQLPTGVNHRTAAFAYRGGGFGDRRDFALAAALIVHPRGDLLIDTGFGRDLARQLALMPWRFRIVTDYETATPAVDQLIAAGRDPARLAGVLLTHAHWDHVSGVADLPGVPVLVPTAERAFIDDGGWITAVARTIPAARLAVYDFEGGPYLGFPRSHDVYGDGAIVVVPAPGHTPGSVIVFVALPDGRRLAFVGDLVWQREGITLREERPWLMRRQADVDAAAVRAGIRHMAALAARFPALVLIPAHDQRGFAALPRLPAR